MSHTDVTRHEQWRSALRREGKSAFHPKSLAKQASKKRGGGWGSKQGVSPYHGEGVVGGGGDLEAHTSMPAEFLGT